MKRSIIILFFIMLAYAQKGLIINSPANYRIGNDEITMNVNLWGHVRQPGSYDIPIGLGLLELISNAGGPATTANIKDIKIVRKNNEIIMVNIKKYIETGDFSLIKKLQPGDLVIVGGSLTNYVKDIFGALRDIGILLNAIVISQKL